MRYIELLKQVPPGKEKIPEKLLKQLDIAACSFVNSLSEQYDLSEEEREEYVNYDYAPYLYDRGGKWGLLDKWPLQLEYLEIYKNEETGLFYLEISSRSSSNMVLKSGSKYDVSEEAERLSKYREAEGEEAFEAEVMRLVDHRQG